MVVIPRRRKRPSLPKRVDRLGNGTGDSVFECLFLKQFTKVVYSSEIRAPPPSNDISVAMGLSWERIGSILWSGLEFGLKLQTQSAYVLCSIQCIA